MKEQTLFNINQIRKCIIARKVIWTKHCLNRLNQRDILIQDVRKAIRNGKIIEYYSNDYPYPSCLILGLSIEKRALHVVCGLNDDCVYMITAYYPSDEKWQEDKKTRRNRK